MGQALSSPRARWTGVGMRMPGERDVNLVQQRGRNADLLFLSRHQCCMAAVTWAGGIKREESTPERIKEEGRAVCIEGDLRL